MKQANHVFEKVTKYAIRKLSVGVGPVAIGTFLLAGGLFVSKPVSADQVTTDASVHMAYVTENELTADDIKDAACVILSNDVAIRNEERFKGKKVVRMGTADIMKKADGLLKKIQDTFQ